jgi:hypothetical protein
MLFLEPSHLSLQPFLPALQCVEAGVGTFIQFPEFFEPVTVTCSTGATLEVLLGGICVKVFL